VAADEYPDSTITISVDAGEATVFKVTVLLEVAPTTAVPDVTKVGPPAAVAGVVFAHVQFTALVWLNVVA
jgi:hypothetical protein